MPQHRLLPRDIRFFEEASSSDLVSSNLRLREGEYQYDLARTIASFQLDLAFPDVKDLIRKSYGEEKTLDLQFVRKIQTILKKMEKSNIVRILPKKNPWQLQRYALSSFRFQDSDKNLVVLATDSQLKQMRDLLSSTLTQQERSKKDYWRVLALITLLGASYSAMLWSLLQQVISPFVFVAGLAVGIVGSLALGKALTGK